MGGHGGLNILPQKKWNVYNRDAREKVERDVRRAEEQKDQEQTRYEQNQAEMRYEILRSQKKRDKLQNRNREHEEDLPKSSLSRCQPPFLFINFHR